MEIGRDKRGRKIGREQQEGKKAADIRTKRGILMERRIKRRKEE